MEKILISEANNNNNVANITEKENEKTLSSENTNLGHYDNICVNEIIKTTKVDIQQTTGETNEKATMDKCINAGTNIKSRKISNVKFYLN